MSSFPLTNSIIFQDGHIAPPIWSIWCDPKDAFVSHVGRWIFWWNLGVVKKDDLRESFIFLSALTHLVKLIGFGELRNSVFFMLLAKSKSRQKYAELIYRFPVSDCFHWSFSSWEASKESLLHRPGKQPNGRASCSWRITHLCFVGQSCHQMPPGFTAVPKQGYPKTNGL